MQLLCRIRFEARLKALARDFDLVPSLAKTVHEVGGYSTAAPSTNKTDCFASQLCSFSSASLHQKGNILSFISPL